MLKKVHKSFQKMASVLNQESSNSVLGQTGGNEIPADGTGEFSRQLGVVQSD